MKPCDCHVPPREATHRLRSGRLLCEFSAAAATERANWLCARETPVPLGPPTLFGAGEARSTR